WSSLPVLPRQRLGSTRNGIESPNCIAVFADTSCMTPNVLYQRLELFLVVCSAIQHAHHKGLIHRDLKPSNALVMEQDGRDRAGARRRCRGFPAPPFRLRSGFPVQPWPRFPRPPCDPGWSDFPNPVLTLATHTNLPDGRRV